MPQTDPDILRLLLSHPGYMYLTPDNKSIYIMLPEAETVMIIPAPAMKNCTAEELNIYVQEYISPSS